MDVADIQQVADDLHRATDAARPIPLITERWPSIDWNTARAIARATDRLRHDDGETQIGWKLGWTSAAMRAALGVERPNWGTLWQNQLLVDDIDLDNYIHPKIEPEFVWRAGCDLAGADTTAQDVMDAGGAWTIGIEVVDPRFPSFDFDALDNTADNSSSAAIVIGPFVAIESASLDALAVSFTDGTETRTGDGNQAMGSQAEAIAWLVRSLADESMQLDAGQIVFTGGLTAPFDVARGHRYTVGADGFADVHLQAR